MRYLILVIYLLGLYAGPVSAETGTNDVAVVRFHGKELFQVTNISSLPAQQRAKIVVDRIRAHAKSPLVSTEAFRLHNDDELHVTAIMSGADVLCWVLDSDAELHGIPREQLAVMWVRQLTEIINLYRKDYTSESYIKGTVFALVATAVFLGLWIFIRILSRREMEAATRKLSGKQMLKFVDGDSLVTINNGFIRTLRILLLLALLIIYLNLVLSFFPWTFNLSARLFELVSTPFIHFAHGFVSNLPNLFAILVIVFIVHFILRGLRHVFRQIGEGKVRIRGFYADWADTTFRLVRMVIIVFAVVAAFPYIPGSNSPAFKGISIFIGVLFSLGSTSTVGNIFGGLMLTYMRSFQPGDFVEISGLKGTVMARRTFSTRLKTPTNEIISIPNAQVSSNTIINYSNLTKSIGVNIGTTVSIGYDVPWRTVHDLLIQSAEGVEDVLEDPAPTVLQLSLDDFYVQYKLIVATKRPDRMYRILSDLHQNIQDCFARAGVEIMSPHYRANRAGEQPAIPDAGETQQARE